VPTKNVYMIKAILSTAVIIHVRLCQLNKVYMIPPILYIMYDSCKFVPTEKGLYDTTNLIHSRYYSCKFEPAGNGLYDTTSTIHWSYYSCKIVSTETVYMIPPVLSKAGIIHVSLYQLKTVYMIHQYNSQQVLYV